VTQRGDLGIKRKIVWFNKVKPQDSQPTLEGEKTESRWPECHNLKKIAS